MSSCGVSLTSNFRPHNPQALGVAIRDVRRRRGSDDRRPSGVRLLLGVAAHARGSREMRGSYVLWLKTKRDPLSGMVPYASS
mmetsp:Transcript_6571/g.19403  ORF Transcript_6571/g.19403 Transcript_6571/m.19403 type:complete len:82 (-) Transcript_6571:109-354(-)